MQGVLTVLVDDGVTGVVAALEADDDIDFLCQIVDDAAFAFIAPLGANNCSNGNGNVLSIKVEVEIGARTYE